MVIFKVGDIVKFIGNEDNYLDEDDDEYEELYFGRELTINSYEGCGEWELAEISPYIEEDDLELVNEVKIKLKVDKKGYI